MKTLSTYIGESLIGNGWAPKSYKYYPKNRMELLRILSRVDVSDWELINTSNIRNMDELFFEYNGKWGDISEWDVSNVTSMECMFARSNFNGDISNWDISKVENMGMMFMNSDFNNDISSWVLNPDCNTKSMFDYCKIDDTNKPKGVV